MQHGSTTFDRLMLAGLALLGFLLLGPVLTIPLHIPINYNEGWNAGFDTRAVIPGSGPLYPGAGSFVFNNYPPLGFFIVGAAGRFLFGDMIIAGRVVSLLALLAAAGCMGLSIRRLGGTTRSAIAASLLLMLFACSFYRTYVAMDDPQWLAHAMMLASLAVLLRGGTLTGAEPGALSLSRTSQVAAAALLMVAGGFVKHNLVALPLSVTLWLIWLNRPIAIVWVIAAATGIGLGLGLMHGLFGSAAFTDIVHHRRIFRVHLLTHSISRLAPLLPAAAIICIMLRRCRAGHGAVLIALFAAIALVTGVVQRMGEGVYYNAHFETVIAVCLGFGVVLAPAFDRPLQWRRWRFGPGALLVVAALPIIGATPWHLPLAWHDISDRSARQAAWQPLVTRIAGTDGVVGCEMLSLCYWAGKAFTVDVFNLTQDAISGGSAHNFQAMVARRGFALFQYDPKAFLHTDAVRKLGYDPIMGAFAGLYTRVGTGPMGVALLAPADAAR
ncbi:hypothetical protein HN018_18400 [Lichenicola cladoniae]|uniref:Glycosyltransferase RgtA/B/C/D-like domain-containing protein n=1 Tax=Lichenicola cladoniae TaxID=1484109 RepID=A0A6M8HU66_9PROT|nr:hypothetical protein [Lichenicola cladoniae]NPD67617.1 hypothetical protein [Acetobacteraceae bacterium]QKE91741.1 hypothetical protein HN018_18400 [Lichenicola cladoniae]